MTEALAAGNQEVGKDGLCETARTAQVDANARLVAVLAAGIDRFGKLFSRGKGA